MIVFFSIVSFPSFVLELPSSSMISICLTLWFNLDGHANVMRLICISKLNGKKLVILDGLLAVLLLL